MPNATPSKSGISRIAAALWSFGVLSSFGTVWSIGTLASRCAVADELPQVQAPREAVVAPEPASSEAVVVQASSSVSGRSGATAARPQSRLGLAIASYHEALLRDPGWTDGWTELGLLLRELDPEGAKQAFEYAVSSAENIEEMPALAVSLVELGRLRISDGTFCVRGSGDLVLHVFPEIGLPNPLDEDVFETQPSTIGEADGRGSQEDRQPVRSRVR